MKDRTSVVVRTLVVHHRYDAGTYSQCRSHVRLLSYVCWLYAIDTTPVLIPNAGHTYVCCRTYAGCAPQIRRRYLFPMQVTRTSVVVRKLVVHHRYDAGTYSQCRSHVRLLSYVCWLYTIDTMPVLIPNAGHTYVCCRT